MLDDDRFTALLLLLLQAAVAGHTAVTSLCAATGIILRTRRRAAAIAIALGRTIHHRIVEMIGAICKRVHFELHDRIRSKEFSQRGFTDGAGRNGGGRTLRKLI